MKTNLKFEYLHRDEGNYKIFGEIIIRNPSDISAEQATLALREKLIDTEFFFPKDANIPLFEGHAQIGQFFTHWYEFIRFSHTRENPTDSRSVQEFILSFDTQMSSI